MNVIEKKKRNIFFVRKKNKFKMGHDRIVRN